MTIVHCVFQVLFLFVMGLAPSESVKCERRAVMFFAYSAHKPTGAKNSPALRLWRGLRDKKSRLARFSVYPSIKYGVNFENAVF